MRYVKKMLHEVHLRLCRVEIIYTPTQHKNLHFSFHCNPNRYYEIHERATNELMIVVDYLKKSEIPKIQERIKASLRNKL